MQALSNYQWHFFIEAEQKFFFSGFIFLFLFFLLFFKYTLFLKILQLYPFIKEEPENATPKLTHSFHRAFI